MLETAVTLPVILLVLFWMIAFGIYFYDMSVFVYASNKALDKGVGMLTETGLPEGAQEQIEDAAENAANIRMLTSEPVILVNVAETEEEISLTVQIEASFDCNLPLVNLSFPLDAESTYIYKKSAP